jgi:hypothetical protein
MVKGIILQHNRWQNNRRQSNGFVQREWLIEVHSSHDAAFRFGNFLARCSSSSVLTSPPEFSHRFQVIVKREQLLPAPQPTSRMRFPSEASIHPASFIDIPTTELVMNVNPGLEIIGCFPVVDFIRTSGF